MKKREEIAKKGRILAARGQAVELFEGISSDRAFSAYLSKSY